MSKTHMRITIIEDSRESQIKFLESLSSKLDLTVEMQAITSAPFYDEKIEKIIKAFNPDLIILDLLLLEHVDSGFRVLRQLKQSKALKEIPVVVCSKFIGQNSGDRYKKKSLDLGAADALPKIPFPEPDLIINHARKEKAKR